EWERRRLRNRVHLTIGGCLGPCALANVIMLLFEGRQAWFHSMSRAEQVLALYDWIEELVEARQWIEPPAALAPHRFTASTREARADGEPVDDLHLRPGAPAPAACRVPPPALADAIEANRLVANMEGAIAVPRKNGELVFEAPWEGRVFGMAVALYDQRHYAWEEFQRSLIDEIGRAGEGARGPRACATTSAGSRPSSAYSSRRGWSAAPSSTTAPRPSSSVSATRCTSQDAVLRRGPSPFPRRARLLAVSPGAAGGSN